jgi:hypothetical protein
LTLRAYALSLDTELDACATLADVEATLAFLFRPEIAPLIGALRASQTAKRSGGNRG